MAAVAVATLTAATPAQATPPGIPSKATAQSQLGALTVAAQGSTSGYSRDLFPHWTTISGACNTRETVLRRDGSNVVVNSSCAATSGSWYSPYDGASWTAAPPGRPDGGRCAPDCPFHGGPRADPPRR